MEKGYARLWSAAVLRMAVVVLCVITFSPASQGQVEQIQAVITGITSSQHASEINAVLAAQPYVMMSRTDVHTKNLLIHALPECTLDLAALNALIQPFGVGARCFKREPLVYGQFKHLDPQECSGGPVLVR